MQTCVQSESQHHHSNHMTSSLQAHAEPHLRLRLKQVNPAFTSVAKKEVELAAFIQSETGTGVLAAEWLMFQRKILEN